MSPVPNNIKKKCKKLQIIRILDTPAFISHEHHSTKIPQQSTILKTVVGTIFKCQQMKQNIFS